MPIDDATCPFNGHGGYKCKERARKLWLMYTCSISPYKEKK